MIDLAFYVLKMCYSFVIINKRAQRALGRSPEKKVKGHSGANNREPQGHNLNNFGKKPFDDVIHYMKALGLVVSDKKIFESFILKPIY